LRTYSASPSVGNDAKTNCFTRTATVPSGVTNVRFLFGMSRRILLASD